MTLQSALGLNLGANVAFNTSVHVSIAATIPNVTAAMSVSVRDKNLNDVFSTASLLCVDSTIPGSITQSGGVASAWSDAISGLSFAASGTARPAYSASDALFNNKPSLTGDGSDDIMSVTLDRPAPGTTPTWILAVVAQLSSTSGRSFWGTGGNILSCNQGSASPNIQLRNTTAGPTNGNLPIGGARVVIAYYNNNTTDYLVVGSGTPVTGTNTGNTDPGATFSIFARTGGANTNIALAAFCVRAAAPSGAEVTAALAYCNAKFGTPT